jgi:MFS family permease
MHADASTLPLTAINLRRRYYGWRVLMVAAAAMVGTLPGRTQGLGLVTEPLLRDFQLDRVSYATLNFWATIIGSLGAVGIGQLIDRLGSRIVLTVVVAIVGLAVLLTGSSASLAGLAIGVTLTRAFGQSALSVVSLAIVGHWFVRTINRAMAIYSVAMSVGFMLAFPLVGMLVQRWGWRPAWLTVGMALIVILAPAGWSIVRRTPESIGLQPDGDAAPATSGAGRGGGQDLDPLSGSTWGQALLTPAFWVFASGTALYGLVASGIGLFNESILAERGFGADVYYRSLVVTAMAALIGNFGAGWLATRVDSRWLLTASLWVLAGGLLGLPHVRTMTDVMLWATAMGLGGGIVMVLFFSIWPRTFGRRHLGRIQGAAQALTVIASATGPLLLAWCLESTGSYAAMFRILAAIIAAIGVSALVIRVPHRDTTAVRSF